MTKTNAAYATFAALAIGSTFWFRQSDTFAKAAERPIKAIKVSPIDSVIVNGEVGWFLNEREVHSTVKLPEETKRHAMPGLRGYYGWMLSEHDAKLVVWTTDPTVKKARAKKVPLSYTGRRFTLIKVPEGMENVLEVGMKGTMITTGSETPFVVFDNLPKTQYVHTTHMAIHRPRRKMTKDTLPAQTKQVLSLLRSKGSLTAIEAGGVIRARSLSKRVSELKEAGFDVQSETKFDHTGQRYVRYHLIPEAMAA